MNLLFPLASGVRAAAPGVAVPTIERWQALVSPVSPTEPAGMEVRFRSRC